MSSINSTSDIVRPEFFIITGFPDGPYMNYFHFFLFFCYATSLLGNLFLITIISIARSLHKPKYMAVFNLAVCDLGESTTLIPTLMERFFFDTHQISYDACLASVFFLLFFFLLEAFTLTVLAYDRFVAICFPLRYHNIVTNTSMGIIITVVWLLDLMFVGVMVSSLIGLSFCKTIEIYGYCCEFGPIYWMACNDNSFSDILSMVFMALAYFIPVALIGLSYTSVLFALFRITSGKERTKALKTCTSHLMLVAVFFVPSIGVDVASFFESASGRSGMIGAAMSYTLPAVLNPVVYSLSTAEIKEFVKTLIKTSRHKGIGPAVSK